MTKAELEARRSEYEQSIRFVGWDDDCIFSAMNGYDFAAAVLQGEIDAEKERYELALASSIRYGNKVFDLESELQSANAKLAFATKDTERLHWLFLNISGKELRRIGIIYNDQTSFLEAIDFAMDASEGKGNL
mgnify:CR=1 FL=1